jgi:hypothetical protein
VYILIAVHPSNSKPDQNQIMKFSTLLLGGLASLAAAQTPGPYIDAKSGISFNYLSLSSGYFFGIALPTNSTGNTDFIATIGGKGTGWSGASLGGKMLNKLLIIAWPNGKAIVSSFRKTAWVPSLYLFFQISVAYSNNR